MPDLLTSPVTPVPVTADWGDIYELERLDTLSARPNGNDILVRFLQRTGNGWRPSVPTPVYAGGFNTFDEGVVSGYQAFQFQRVNAAAVATVDFKAFQK